MTNRSHYFSLGSIQPQKVYTTGTRRDATKENFPVLNGMALSVLEIGLQGVREPHWHPNAHELGYCLEGKGIMTVFGPGSYHETFTIEPGSLSFIPMGYIHHIENVGNTPLRLILCFNHEIPEEINLSSAVDSMTSHILGDTFQLAPSFFEGLNEKGNPVFIFHKDQITSTELNWETNVFKFDLEGVQPQIQTKGGWAKMGNQLLFPSLDGLAVFTLLLNQEGVREPHWHPNAHEFNYLVQGSARITLLSPNGTLDTFDMKAGDVSFLPKGYFHHIENTADHSTHFIVFFNHSNPTDIGLTGCLGAYSNEILASLFKVPTSYFNLLPKYQKDLLVVGGG